MDATRKLLAHARAWVEAILNEEEYEGRWLKKDLEKTGECSRCNVHVDSQ